MDDLPLFPPNGWVFVSPESRRVNVSARPSSAAVLDHLGKISHGVYPESLRWVRDDSSRILMSFREADSYENTFKRRLRL